MCPFYGVKFNARVEAGRTESDPKQAGACAVLRLMRKMQAKERNDDGRHLSPPGRGCGDLARLRGYLGGDAFCLAIFAFLGK